jgi:hypothetical protein
VPETFVRSKRSIAVAVAATVVGVSATVLLSGQSTTALAAAAPGSTVRASVVTSTNAQAPQGSEEQELSSDGTAIAFSSRAQFDNLGTGESDNVFVRDLRRNRTVMISRGQFVRPNGGTDSLPETPGLGGDPLLSLNGRRTQPPPQVDYGETPPNGASASPSISADGRYVAFMTQADNILPEDLDTDWDLLICDRDPNGDGVFDEVRADGSRIYAYFRVNKPEYRQGDGGWYRTDHPSAPKLSDNADRIVWSDLIAPLDGPYYVVVRTAALRPPLGGAVGPPASTELVDTTLDGRYRSTGQYWPDVSGDGRYIVLVSDYERREGPVEFPDVIPFHAVIRKDTASKEVLRVDWDVNTIPDHAEPLSVDESVHLSRPAISNDGGVIAFEAEEYRNNCAGDGNCWHSVAEQPMVYVVRIDENSMPIDSIVASRDNDNGVINGFMPALSGNGRFLAFGTDNHNAHDGVDEEASGENYSCLTYNPGFAAKPMLNLSGLPPTSADRDNRTSCQIVVRDLVVDRQRGSAEDPRLRGTLATPGAGECAGGTCVANNDTPPYVYSTGPSLSNNGSTIAYSSWATNLVPGVVDDNNSVDVFVRTFQPQLRPDPNPLDFGTVELGDTFDRTVRFDHIGLGPLVVSDVVIDGVAGAGDFTVGAQTCSGEAVVLQQTDNCEISVSFAPAAAGDRKATLRLTLRDGREFAVPLVGKGSEQPAPPKGARFAAGPDPVSFGDRLLLSTGAEPAVTVTNVGGSPLTVSKITLLSTLAPNDYAVASDTCTGAPVPAGGTCKVTIRFSPTAPGNRTAVLRFEDNAPGGDAHLVGLSGAGSTPTVLVSPAVTQPGRVIIVTGQGYAPNRAVTITLTGSVERTTVLTDGAGGFTKSLLILPRSYIGNRPVVATVDSFPTIKAEKPVLIVTPSVGPADFVIRG